MLSELFTEFDKECNRLDLYKVYTIGDCYVVMGFLDKNNRKPPEYECQDIVQLSLTMIDIIAKTRKAINFDGLTMRIGVHTVSYFYWFGLKFLRGILLAELLERILLGLTCMGKTWSLRIRWRVVEHLI
jgi:hypothetical protein